MFDEAFIAGKVEALLVRARCGELIRPPVDPSDIASLCSVLSVEDRPMVPEGVMKPVRGGFQIFLQDNFLSDPGGRLRRRFTLAHELVHTFFYSIEGNSPKLMKGAPRGANLERLCHFGASEILVPAALLRRHLQLSKVTSAEQLLGLAGVFDVSLEVIIRRVQKLGLVAEEEFAAALVDRTRDGEVIRAACYGSLLLSNLPRPTRGLQFDTWVGPLRALGADPGLPGPILTRTAEIRTRKVHRSTRSYIFEFKFAPLRS